MKKNQETLNDKYNVISKKWDLIFTILLVFVALLVLLPLILLVIVSFSSSDSITKVGYNFFPVEWSLEGYRYLLDMGDQLLASYLVTIAYTVIGTVVGVFLMTMYAYVISRKDFKFSKPLTWLMFFPLLFQGGLLPSYIFNVRYYHLNDSFWVLVLPNLIAAYSTIILRTFIKTSIPESLYDAAKIDGAGQFTIFARIVLPLSKPGIATIALFSFIGKWNDWLSGLLYIENPKLVPLQTLLVRLQNNVDFLKQNASFTASPEGLEMLKSLPGDNLRMACTLVSIIPILFAYPFFQRYFVRGLTVGSIKE